MQPVAASPDALDVTGTETTVVYGMNPTVIVAFVATGTAVRLDPGIVGETVSVVFKGTTLVTGICVNNV